MNYEWVPYVLGFVTAVLGFVAAVIVKKLTETKPVSPKKKISVSTSSSSSSGCNYEVFLSFRGADTRNGFTDHLYKALKDHGIHTFRDDEELRTGEEIGPDLLAAIHQSTIAIPVFSEGYASSKWCLIEIAMIAECKKKGQIVLPIFYRVEPSEVRNQTGRYAEDFRKHEKRYVDETVKEWREALADVGKLKGWDVDKNRKEADLISLVVETVLQKLKNSSLIVSDNLVGIDSHIEEMIRLLYTESKQTVGIHGMGGIGKTTIAKATFNKICSQFDGCSFLADIRGTCQQPRDFVFMQNKLISDILSQKEQSVNNVDEGIKVIRKRFSNKRILLVVDDVDHIRQLNALAGKCDWFGLGSRIIITTRDKDVLNLYGVDGIYEPKEMDLNQSIQLLSKHAFRKDQPPEDYVDISQKVAQTTGGLPLALEVIGSFLFLKPKSVWIETLKKLKKKPNAEVQDKLRISYDGLDDEEKAIFLDLACFFIGTDREIATHIWGSSDFFPETGILILQLKSLVKIDDKNKLWMHDQLRDLGREIVRKENPLEPGERSRLWSHEEVLNVLRTGMGTRRVEGLHLDFGYASKDHYLKSEGFQAMSKLRLLRVDYTNLVGNFEHLFSKLKWLSWKGCSLEFTAANFHLEELAVLELSQSSVTEDWKGWQQIQKSTTLKVLNLTDCCLNRTPDFSAFSNLEILILEGCWNLLDIDDSIGLLKSLIFLNLNGCDNLVKLPTSICKLSSLQNFLVECAKLQTLPIELGRMKGLTKIILDNAIRLEQLPESIGLLEDLKTLTARYCSAVTELPRSIGYLKSLSDLLLDGTRISVLPDSIGLLQNLRCLSLKGCFLLRKIPDSIEGLVSLEKLDLFGTDISEIPDSIGNLRNLTFLRIDLTNITRLPDSVGLLEKLEVLSTRHCKRLVKQPGSVGRLRHLQCFEMYLNDWGQLPADFETLTNLKKLSIGGMKILESNSFLESSASLCLLEELLLYNWAISEGETLGDIGRLSSLRTLKLENSSFRNLPASICSLSLLRSLEIRNCPYLQSIPKLPSSLRVLEAEDNSSLETLADVSNLTNLEELNLRFCRKLVEIPTDIGNSTKLESLHLGRSDIATLPPTISTLNRLKVLDVHCCEKLKSLPELPASLIELNAVGCMSLEKLPNLSNLKRLKHLRLDGCLKLVEIQGLEELESLVTLKIAHCRLITKVPDLTGLPDLNTSCIDPFEAGRG